MTSAAGAATGAGAPPRDGPVAPAGLRSAATASGSGVRARLIEAALVAAAALPAVVAIPMPRAAWPVLLSCGAVTLVAGFPPRLARPVWWMLAALALFLAYAGLAAGWSPRPGAALTSAFDFAALIAAVLGLAAAITASERRVRERAATALLVGFAVGAALCFVEIVFDHPLYRLLYEVDPKEGFPAEGINRSVVSLALYVWPVALVLYRRGRRLLAIALPVLVLALVTPSPSGSAILGLLAGLAMLAVAAVAPTLARRLLIGLFALAFLGTLPLVSLFGATGLVDATWMPVSARHRLEIWEASRQSSLLQPILGHGLEATRVIDDVALPSRFQRGGLLFMHPHNLFLQVWLEIGAIGAILGCFASVALVAAIRRLEGEVQLFALPLAGSVLALFSVAYGAWQSWWMGAIALSGLMLLLAERAPDARLTDP